MPIIEQSTGSFNLAPEGIHPMAVVSVEDITEKLPEVGPYGPRKTTFVARCANKAGETADFFFTPSLAVSPKTSTLAAFLKAATGSVPTRVNTDDLPGMQFTAVVEHQQKGDRTNARIKSFAKPATGQNIGAKKSATPVATPKQDPLTITDDDLVGF